MPEIYYKREDIINALKKKGVTFNAILFLNEIENFVDLSVPTNLNIFDGTMISNEIYKRVAHFLEHLEAEGIMGGNAHHHAQSLALLAQYLYEVCGDEEMKKRAVDTKKFFDKMMI